MTTPILKLPEISQAQTAYLTHNEALRQLEVFVGGSVISRSLTTPPTLTSPADDGKVYIPATAATGAWLNKANHLAVWSGGAWYFYLPTFNLRVYSIADGNLIQYDGTNWILLITSGDMTKSVYDTNNNGIVDTATTSLAVSGTTAANQYYGTNSSNVKGFYNLPSSGAGDMTKSIYDTNNDGIVDTATTSLAVSGTTAANQYYGTNSSNVKGFYNLPSGGSGGGSSGTFEILNQTTASITAGSSVNLDLTIGTICLLRSLTTNKLARLRLFSSAADRTADTASNTTQLTSQSGLILDTEINGTYNYASGIVANNLDTITTNILYAKIFNNSGTTGTVNFILKYFKLAEIIAVVSSTFWNSVTAGSYVTLSNGNLNATFINPAGNVKANVRTNTSKTSGKWYWEVKVLTSGGSWLIGIVNTAYVNNNLLGSTNSCAYSSFTGSRFLNASSQPYGSSYGINDVVGVALDLDNNQITFYKNGVSQGVISGLNSGQAYHPAVSDAADYYNNAMTVQAYFTAPFNYTIPSGYTAIG